MLISSVRTVPIANPSAVNYGSVTNVSDSAKQIKHELDCDQEAPDVAKEELQVLDQLIVDDAERRLSSGANLTEISPTTEDLVPGQLNSGQLLHEEMVSVKKELDTTNDTVNAEMIQVLFACSRYDCVVRTAGVRYSLRGG